MQKMRLDSSDFAEALAEKPLHLTGLVAAILTWIVIFSSIHYNSWFIFTEHAFSDLGGQASENPWIYNHGMVMLGVLMLLYSLALIKNSLNKIECVGGAFMFIAGVFLALIGIYPSGTRPHNFVSTWFFVQADLAIIAWGIGLLLSGLKAFGVAFTGMGVLGPLVAAAVKWPSTAVLEAYGIVLLDAWVVLMMKVHHIRVKKRATNGRSKSNG